MLLLLLLLGLWLLQCILLLQRNNKSACSYSCYMYYVQKMLTCHGHKINHTIYFQCAN